jgi:branched-chain amino acid transport system permease protein
MMPPPHMLLGVVVPTGTELATAVVTGVLLGGLYAVTALGLSLVFGVMRLINLAHGELITLGAYIAFELSTKAGFDPLVTVVIVAPALFLIGVPVQRWLLTPLMSRDVTQPLLTTFGLSVIAQNLYIQLFSADSRSLNASYATSALRLAGINVPTIYLIAFGFGLVLCGGTHLMIRRTAFGREVRAAAEDAEAARTLGVDVGRVYMVLFGLAAAMAAIGGVLVGLTFSFDPTSGTDWLLTGFAVVVLGGLGSIKGTLVGGILLGLVESVGAAFFGDGYLEVIGLVTFLIVLTIRPQGLFGGRA